MRPLNIFVSSLCLWVGLPLAAQPAISFEPESIRISGLTPGGDAVYLAAARIAHGYSRDMATETGTLSDSDGDGVTSIPLHRRLPLHSLWIAIDLSTGRSVIASPDASAGGAVHRPEKLKLSDLREPRGKAHTSCFSWSVPVSARGR